MFLFSNWDRKIKGIHCPNDWSFNDFWTFLVFSATDDAKVLRKVKEDEERKLSLRALAPKIDKFANAFYRVSPLIAKSANRIIAQKEREVQDQQQIYDALDLLLGDFPKIRKKKVGDFDVPNKR